MEKGYLFFDDKHAVILSIAAIVICGIYAVPEADVGNIITHGITALGSLAVGKSLNSSG